MKRLQYVIDMLSKFGPDIFYREEKFWMDITNEIPLEELCGTCYDMARHVYCRNIELDGWFYYKTIQVNYDEEDK